MTYKMIAFDMDGTLLSSKKTILPSSIEAIHKAHEAGKEVVLLTGRPMTELVPHVKETEVIRYAVCESGAVIYDFQDSQFIDAMEFTPQDQAVIKAAAMQEEVLVQTMLIGDVCVLSSNPTAPFNPELPFTLLEKNLFDFLLEKRFQKINFYHQNIEARERTYNRLKDTGLSLAREGDISLEITPAGVTKGSGLIRLGNMLGINPEEIIAVGDSYNDITSFKTAGLPIAMGNARDEIKALAKAVVSDNDHDGCAEAIYNYLLND